MNLSMINKLLGLTRKNRSQYILQRYSISRSIGNLYLSHFISLAKRKIINEKTRVIILRNRY